MRYVNYKKIISSVIVIAVCSLLSFNVVFAQSSMGDLLKKAGLSEGAGFAEATETSASSYLGSIIQYALSFLGVIFIVLLIYGGFIWMTAQGDAEEVTKAKDIIYNALIGLVIVLAAFVITQYIFRAVITSTGFSGEL